MQMCFVILSLLNEYDADVTHGAISVAVNGWNSCAAEWICAVHRTLDVFVVYRLDQRTRIAENGCRLVDVVFVRSHVTHACAIQRKYVTISSRQDTTRRACRAVLVPT